VLGLKWKISNRKTSLYRGKETNKAREERKDPFLSRKEKKHLSESTFLKATKALNKEST